MLFSHLSYCETAVKINAVPNIQGQTEITCGWPNEKQRAYETSSLCFMYLCVAGLGEGGEESGTVRFCGICMLVLRFV